MYFNKNKHFFYKNRKCPPWNISYFDAIATLNDARLVDL